MHPAERRWSDSITATAGYAIEVAAVPNIGVALDLNFG
jgi:hypothetical protein